MQEEKGKTASGNNDSKNSIGGKTGKDDYSGKMKNAEGKPVKSDKPKEAGSTDIKPVDREEKAEDSKMNESDKPAANGHKPGDSTKSEKSPESKDSVKSKTDKPAANGHKPGDSTKSEKSPESKDPVKDKTDEPAAKDHKSGKTENVSGQKPDQEQTPESPFKGHPAFKKKKAEKLHGMRLSTVNPFRRIIVQHQEHRMRIAKITAAVFVVLVIIGLIAYFIETLIKEQKRQKKIDQVEKLINKYDKTIPAAKDYKKYKTAYNIIKLIQQGRRIDDLENAQKWLSMKQKYLKILEPSKPTGKANFIYSKALLDMVFIPQGRFTIGRKNAEKGDQDETPRHPVIIADDFWISRTEVTVEQYRTVYTRFRMEKWRQYYLDRSYQPAVNMNWHEANEFCEIITSWAKTAKILPEGYVFRLPTEAEWEYTCRAGTNTYYFWGDKFGETGAKFANSLDRYSARLFDYRDVKGMAANDGHRVSAPVASYQPNAFGLYDMPGNVWEWCYDWYNPKAYEELPHKSPVQSQPTVVKFLKRSPFDDANYYIDTTTKVIRGGSWLNYPSFLRSANRDHYIPNNRNTGIGFRVVLGKKIIQKPKPAEDSL